MCLNVCVLVTVYVACTRYVRILSCMYVCMYVPVCMYVCVYVRMYACMYVCIYYIQYSTCVFCTNV